MFQLIWSFFHHCRPADAAPRSGKSLDPELTHAAAALLRGCGCDRLADKVIVRWNRRLTTTAGLARFAQAEVALNLRLQEFPAEVDRTLRHELAHLVAADRAGRRRVAAHGPEWRRACADLGIPGESRCHDLPLPRREVARRHAYRCPHCEYILRRARPMSRRRRLACRDCCQRHAGGQFDRRFEFIKLAG